MPVDGKNLIQTLREMKETYEEAIRNGIYINGDAVVKGFGAIESLFKTLMFDKKI